MLVIVVAGRWETNDETAVGFDAIAGLVAAARGVKDVLDDIGRRDPELQITGEDAVRGVIVTENAFRLPGDQHEPELAHAALVGARRALLNEQPRPRWRLVDVESDSTAGELQAELLSGSAADDDADEVCLRQETRLVPRLRKTLASHLERFTASAPVADMEESFELEVPRSGRFEDLALRSCERVAPGPGEVELRIETVGLNHEDFDKVRGVLSAEDVHGTYFQTAVGMQGFGVVTRVGPGVTDISPDDRMWVLVRDMFRRYLTIPIDGGFLSPAPSGAKSEHCVSVLPFVTAQYGLCHAAGVTSGETVLIHGAADGAGLAAVQVAKSLGARVVASAGSDQHRRFVLAAGADEVVNSRSSNFVDEVLRMTDGRGVDVIFNSEPGEVAWQNLRVAAEFGRIVEIGKADIRRGAVIDLRSFDRNLAFMAVDTDRLLGFRPEVFKDIARHVLDRLDNGEYQPLLATAYLLSDISDAFEAIARPEHVGEVLVTMDATVPVRPRRPEFVVRADATYLITGGFGAFGMATARWLVSRGARHLVLVSRRGAATSAAQAQQQAIAAAGVQVVQALADVANHDEVEALVSKTVATMPPLRGVFHAAGVIDDLPLAEISQESLRRVMNPKVRGALNLHAVLDDVGADLDAFVLYSSVSALVGPVPQIAYAGANAVLDALAAARRAQAKPALSINWGALAGGGMAEASDEVERYLAVLGVRPIAMERATALLQECLGLGGEVVAAVVSDMDWAQYEAACPASAASSRFAEHIADASSGGSGAAALRQELSRLPEEQRGEVLAFVLAEQLSEVLGISADGVDLAAPLTDLGVDSLMTVEFSARVHIALGIELTSLDLSRGVGLSGIADFVATQLSGGDGAGAPAPPPGLEPVPGQVSAPDDSSFTPELKKVA